MSFKDYFSKQATDYKTFRPTYPEALYRFVVEQAPGRELAWDVGTGNGQAAVGIAPFFTRVVATDPSQKQIDHATRRENVYYLVTQAEKSPLNDGTVDLVTVAQAMHWF